jgi:CO/xanthine dehydrogenase Mo-binding subunit
MRFGIGQPVTRKEDPRFLTGRGRYVADNTPTVMNATLDALAPSASPTSRMPATPERIWRAVREQAGD